MPRMDGPYICQTALTSAVAMTIVAAVLIAAGRPPFDAIVTVAVVWMSFVGMALMLAGMAAIVFALGWAIEGLVESFVGPHRRQRQIEADSWLDDPVAQRSSDRALNAGGEGSTPSGILPADSSGPRVGP